MFKDSDWAWVIEQAINFGAPALAAWIAFRIALTGYKYGLKQQSENHKQQFQIRMFERLNEEIEKCTKAISEYNALLTTFEIHIQMDYQAQKEERKKVEWGLRAENIQKRYFECLSGISNISETIESHLIIEPKLAIFQKALGAKHHDISNFYSNNSQIFYDYTTKEITNPDGTSFKVAPKAIKDTECERIKKLIADASDSLIDTTCYCMDLKVDAQNILLGGIFSNSVCHRIPIDPERKVITVQNYEELKKYFENETAMGKEQTKLNEELKQKYSKV